MTGVARSLSAPLGAARPSHGRRCYLVVQGDGCLLPIGEVYGTAIDASVWRSWLGVPEPIPG